MRYVDYQEYSPTGCALPVATTRAERLVEAWITAEADVDKLLWQALEAGLSTPPPGSNIDHLERWLETAGRVGMGQMPLMQALKLLKEDEREAARRSIEAIAKTGPQSRSMAKSLFAELQLSVAHWARLLEAFDHPTRSEKESLRVWGCEHLFQGAVGTAPMPLGRVLEKNALVRSLMTCAKVPRRVALETVADLCSATQWERARRACAKRDVQLGGEVMWATFDDTADDPFAFAEAQPQRGRYIRASLGLERDPASQRRYLPMLLFRYNTVTPCHTPTCADAAKYEDWNVYFAPAVSRWPGLTQPWDDGDLKAQPRPEVVHRQQSLSAMSEPAEEVR
ncbi:MAG: hypothetical protein LBT54_00360 [Bifidobacteriaceae bacterium]|jgi:hypothetical protein|nr:hypothetical protein [Bifidobacteriaceae bacterium]